MTIRTFTSRLPLTAALAAVALLSATVSAPGAVAQEPSLEVLAERLQLLEDKEAIRGLLERYYEHQEAREFEAFANLFAADGELVLRRGTASGGPAGILASMTSDSEGSGDAAAAPASSLRHILSNVQIEVTGDAATATSRWTLLATTEDNRARVGGTGRYSDELVRENGEWKFRRRVIARDIPLDLEGANPETE